MRRTYALLAVFALVVGVIAIAGPAAAHTEDAPFVTQLIAGGGSPDIAVDVGEVQVWNDGDHPYVKYLVDAELTPGGAPTLITETHLAVATNPSDLPQTKKGNPIPGQSSTRRTTIPGWSTTPM
jgi:hypothetical protein